MGEKYQDDAIEFAVRLLNRRQELKDEEVEVWLEEPEHRRLLDEMAGIKRVLQSEKRKFDKEEAWKRLRQDRRRSYPVRRVFRMMTLGVAAVCLLGLGIWMLWPGNGMYVTENSAMSEVIVPGGRQAELVLADGNRIGLGSATRKITTNSVTGIVDDSVGGLNYSQVAVLDEQIRTEYNLLRVPKGGFYKLSLPDGTTVWLNADSELRFPVCFGNDRRQVFLHGEAFFDVAGDSLHPFVVKLDNADVTVLGTKFNVNAYKDEEAVYTTLAEGAVAFRSVRSGEEIRLKPGEQSVMDVKDGKTLVKKVDPAVYSAWVGGRFVFHAMDLEKIMRQLGRWYDCEVFYTSEEVKRYEFRGAVNRDMELREVLDIIEETTDLHFKINGRTIIVGK